MENDDSASHITPHEDPNSVDATVVHARNLIHEFVIVAPVLWTLR
jgi:hypothetical protein